MPFYQKLNIPKEMEKMFNLSNFDGGLNNVKSAFELQHNESPDLLNVFALESGSIETRPGTFKYITAQIDDTIKKMFLYETLTFTYLLLSSATKLYRASLPDGAVSEVCVVNGVISGIQYEDQFYFVDGEAYRNYDGTDVYTMTTPVSVTLQLVSATVNTVTLPSTASAVDDYYNGWEIYVGNGTGVDQKRTISDYNGTTKVAAISANYDTTPDNTSLVYLTPHPMENSYTDNVAKTKTYYPSYQETNDNFKGFNIIDIINGCTQMVLHKQRIWFTCDPAHPNLAFSTDIDNLLYVPTNTYQPPVTNDGDIIMGVYSFNDVLALFKKNTLFALYGYDETDYELKEVTVECGTININTVCQVGNYLYYLGSDGRVYALYDVRTDYKKMLTRCISESIDLIKHPISVYPENWHESRAIYYNNLYILVVSNKVFVLPSAKGWYMWNDFAPTAFLTYNNTLLAMDDEGYVFRWAFNRFYVTEQFTATEGQTDFMINFGWLEYKQDMLHITVNGIAVNFQDIRLTSTINAQIAPCSTDDVVEIEYLSMLSYTDNGRSYSSYWYSLDLDFGYPSNTKQLKNVFFSAIALTYTPVDVRFNAYIDYYDVGGGVTIQNGITMWGIAKFGERYTDRNVVVPYIVPINRRGKIVRFCIAANGEIQPFKIFTINGRVIIRNK